MSNCIKSKYDKCPLRDNCFGLVDDSEDCKCRLEDYHKGRADGYSKAESDYFAQSQKDREDTYACGYAIGRADAFENLIKDYCITDNFGYEYVIIDKATLEQLKENNAKNEEAN